MPIARSIYAAGRGNAWTPPAGGGGGGRTEAAVWPGITRATDGSQADVQSKINAASDGDIITLPAGTFTWTSGITVSGKGILL